MLLAHRRGETREVAEGARIIAARRYPPLPFVVHEARIVAFALSHRPLDTAPEVLVRVAVEVVSDQHTEIEQALQRHLIHLDQQEEIALGAHVVGQQDDAGGGSIAQASKICDNDLVAAGLVAVARACASLHPLPMGCWGALVVHGMPRFPMA